ncbi:MAG: GNAT family N-acetyltransferase [Anaerolineae bacterium]|nr:GNAT family N-acetyltransferase [Anaerolineae bacterium]
MNVSAQPQNPILRDFPDQFESERLIIRAPRPGDGPAVNEAIHESLDELKPWMPWADPAPSVADTEAHMRGAAARFLQREDLPLLLFRKNGGLFIGGSGLHRINWSVPCMEIGYWVRTSQQGNGYITEAVRRITTFALEKLGAQRVEIRCDARNTRSAAVAERAGYSLEARFHHHMRGVDGVLRDTLIYVLFPGA